MASSVPINLNMWRGWSAKTRNAETGDSYHEVEVYLGVVRPGGSVVTKVPQDPVQSSSVELGVVWGESRT